MVDVEKYRRAGVIAQSALQFIIKQLHQNIGDQSIGEVCRAGDEFIRVHADQSYRSAVERGIALPVQICKNELVSGVAPEQKDVYQGGIVSEGDLVKISLGVHIDGYTAQVAHTIVIREKSNDQEVIGEPFDGFSADAAVGAFLATEAIVSLLGSVLSDQHPLRSQYPSITGSLMRKTVESIADDFGLKIVAGSRIRRVKRFVVGQPTVQDDLDGVYWPSHVDKVDNEEQEQWTVKPGQTYLIDIRMASCQTSESSQVKVVEAPPVGSVADPAAIYCRDHTVSYNLRTNAARTLLSKADGVFPFKLSYLEGDATQLRLGLAECLQRHLLVAQPIERSVLAAPPPKKETLPVATAQEMATVMLIPAAKSASGFSEVLRLGGGRQIPPSWLHSRHEVSPGVAADSLNARLAGSLGIKYLEVSGSLAAPESALRLLNSSTAALEPTQNEAESGAMDIEM